MVISNTGPLVALETIGLIELLPELFGRISVSAAVRLEIEAGLERPGADLFAQQTDWLHVMPDAPMPDAWLASALDVGEAATIALALQQRGKLVIMDDRKGRRVAEQIYGLSILGTVGILVRAKNAGLISPRRDAMSGARVSASRLSSFIFFHPWPVFIPFRESNSH
jgi:predicted nucleic acid-binding protein